MNPAPLCVLFDLDGTLADSASDLGLAANLVRQECGLPPLPLELYRPQASNGARGLLKLAIDIAPGHADYEARKSRFLKHYENNLSTHTRLFDGVPAMLEALTRAGIRWGIVTNKAGWLSRPVVRNLGLAEQCAVLVSGDSTAHPKPAPDGLLLAAREVGVAVADCIYVGDDLRDMISAQAAGMRGVAAGWGYLGQHPDVTTWNADSIAMTPAALTDLIVLRRAAA